MSDTGPALFASAQGQGAVSAANLNTLTQSCNTFADLRAFIGVTGIMVYARGGTSIGDSKQGFFYWNASGTGPDDNQNTIVPTSAGTTGVWTRSPIIASLVGVSSDVTGLYPVTDNGLTLGNATHRWSSIYGYALDLKDSGSGHDINIIAPALSANYTFQFPASQGTLGQLLVSGGSGNPPVWQSGGNAALAQGLIGGLVLLGTTSTTVSYEFGYCVSDDITTFMQLPAGIIKTTGAWVAGNGNGGLDTGTIAASTTYSVFVIKNTASGATDALISTAQVTPILPAGYSKQRRIGGFVTDGSANVVNMTQIGNLFLLATPVSINGTIGTSGSLITLSPNMPLSGGGGGSVPLTAMLCGSVTNAAANVSVILSAAATADTAPSANYNTAITQVAAQAQGLGRIDIPVNIFSQIRARASANTTTLNLSLIGWIDIRGFDG